MAAVAAAAAAVAPPGSSALSCPPRSFFMASSTPKGLSLGIPWRASIAPSGQLMRICFPQSSSFSNTLGLKHSSSEYVRAASSTDEASTTSSTPSIQTDEIFADLKAKWNSIEDKTNVLIYGGGALVALWVSSTIVGAVNSVPLLPKVLELVGLGYVGWFVYRYLLFKDSRKELVKDIDELKSKIDGSGKD